MKPIRSNPFRSALLVSTCLALSPCFSQAGDITQANNTDGLNLSSSWALGAVPLSTDVAVWDSNVTAANTVSLGADLSWFGLKIVDPGGAVVVNAGNTLTLGSSGVDMGAATQNLTLNHAVDLGSAQTWNVASGRTLTVGGVVSGGFGLTLAGSGAVALNSANTYSGGTILGGATVTLGNNAAFGTGTLTLSGGTINLNAKGITNPVNVTANTTSNLYYTTSGATAGLNGPITGSGTIQNNNPTGTTRNFFITGDLSGFTGTIDLAGGSDNVTLGNGTAGSASYDGSNAHFIVNSTIVHPVNLGATTGTFKMGDLSGSGSFKSYNTHTVEIGALNNETTFSGTLAHQTGYSLSMTKVGTAKLTLSGANISYNGATNVNNGTLSLTNATAYASSSTTVTTPGVLDLNNTTGTTWTFAKAVTGTGSLTKSGSGTVTLSAAQTYSGTTSVNAGTLYLTNSLNPASAISVGDTATFKAGNTTTVGNLSIGNGGRLEVDATKTLTAGNLTSSGSTTLAASLAVGAYSPLVVNTLTTTGSTVLVSPLGVPASGTCHLVTFTTFNGSLSDFQMATPSRVLTLVKNGNQIDLVVDGSNHPVWTGNGDQVWTTATQATKNWKLAVGGAATDFLAGDIVSFDDTATNTSVYVEDTDVNPLSMVFTNETKDYTLEGVMGITAGNLVKSGAGALSIRSPFSFPGGTTLNAGTLAVTDGGALGAGAVTAYGGTLATDGSTVSLANPVSLAGGLKVGGFDDLTLTGSVSGTGILTKVGEGSVILSGANSHSGGIVVSQGTLRSNATAAFGSGAITLGDANTGANPVTLSYNALNTSATNVVVSPNGTGDVIIKWSEEIFGASDKAYNTSTDMVLTLGRMTTFQQTAANKQLSGKITGGVAPGQLAMTVSGGGIAVITCGQNSTSTGGILNDFTGDVLITGNTVLQAQNRAYMAANDNTSAAWTNLLIPDASSVTIDSGSELRLAQGVETVGGLNGSGLVTNGYNAPTLTVGGGNRDGSFSGSFMLNIVKIGSGTQIISGTNTHSGTVTVNGGALELEAATVTGAVTVKSAATLKGNGTVSAATTVESGGIVAPGKTGAVIDTLNLASATLSGTYQCDLGATTSDLIAVTGALTVGSTTNITFSGAPAANEYTIATYGTLAGSMPTITPPAGYVIDTATAGQIKLIKSAGFQSWMAARVTSGFTGDTAVGADPDGDGIKNLMEYVLNGNPGASDLSLLPHPQVTATDFVFTFTRRVDSAADTAQVFEYGSNLVGWTLVNITGTPGAQVAIGVATGTAPNQVQTITITIPRSAAVNGKLFGRLQVTQP